MRSKKPRREPTRRSSRLRGYSNVDCTVGTANEMTIVENSTATVITAQVSPQKLLQHGAEDVAENAECAIITMASNLGVTDDDDGGGEGQEEISTPTEPSPKEPTEDFKPADDYDGAFQIMRVYPVSGNLEQKRLSSQNIIIQNVRKNVACDPSGSPFPIMDENTAVISDQLSRSRGSTKRRIVIQCAWGPSKDENIDNTSPPQPEI